MGDAPIESMRQRAGSNESGRWCGVDVSVHGPAAVSWIKKHGIATAIILWVVISSTFHVRVTSIWYDEAITMLTASGHARPDFSLGMEQFRPESDFRKIALDLRNQDVHPPLYFWVLALWRVVLGPSLEVARSLSTVFIVGGCVLLYGLAQGTGMKWPWIPVVIYALGCAGVLYAWNARPYAMASFLILLTQVLSRRRSRWTGICAAASIATHYFAALCVAPILIMVCVEEWKRHRAWVTQTALTFAAGVAPLVALLRTHFAARPQQYTGLGPLPRELFALVKGSVADTLSNSWLPGWGFALIIVVAFVLAGIRWSWERRAYWIPAVYLGFLSGLFLLSVATNKSIEKMPVEYYAGIAAPWLALLVGFGVNAYPRWSPVLLVVVVTGMMTAAPLVKSTDYRLLASRIRSECSGCVVVVGNGYAGAVPACILYESGGMKVITANPSDTPQSIADRAGEQQPVVFVKTNEPPTARIEDRFVHAYPSVWRGGYFEVFTQGTPNPGTLSDEAKRIETLAPAEARNDWHGRSYRP